MSGILYATDFSSNANNALDFAVYLARKSKQKLFVMHSFQVPLMAPADSFTSREETMALRGQRLMKNTMQKLDELCLDKVGTDVHFEILALEGNPEKCLRGVIKDYDISVLVMGNKGESADRDLLIGSVSEHMLNKATCPILIVPSNAKIGAMDNIAYATDYFHDESSIVSGLFSWANLFDARLHFVHVNQNGAQGPYKKSIEKIANQQSGVKVLISDIESGEVVEGLDKYLRENNIGLLSMTTHTKSIFQKLFHKSITKKMVAHSDIPMLCFSQQISDLVFL